MLPLPVPDIPPSKWRALAVSWPAWAVDVCAGGTFGLAATAIRSLLDAHLGGEFPYALCFFAVLAAAGWRGTRGGLTATAVGLTLAVYFFIEPRYTFGIAGTARLAGFAVVLAASVAVSFIGGAMCRARRAIRESEYRFRTMADHAPVLIWVAGTDKGCTWFNKPWLEFVGRSMEQELGDGWAQNVHPDDLDRCLRTYTEAFDARRPFSMEYRLRRRDGEYRWVIDHGAPRQAEDGAFAGYIGSCFDISERMLAERALEDANRQKDEFLAMLSHELRNPLAAVTSAAQVIKLSNPTDPRVLQARDVIDRQAKQMGRMIEDLLDVSRFAMDKATIKREVFDLADAVRNAAATASAGHRADARRVSVDAASPVWVDGDQARIEQVVANLLDNAFKFSATHARASLRREGGEAVLEIADDGEGIAPEFVGRVFEPFVRGAGDSQRKPGLGLGLAVVKGLAELHGGSVSAESPGRGQGATFTVRLPAAAAPAERPDSAGARKPVRPRRILIVEDNEDTRRMLRGALALEGHQVTEASDGAAGIEAAAQAHPEIAIIDIGLPDIDGYEVARRLRRGGDATVLVALTGYGQAEDRRRALAAGFHAHLVKPVTPEGLGKVVAMEPREPSLPV